MKTLRQVIMEDRVDEGVSVPIMATIGWKKIAAVSRLRRIKRARPVIKSTRETNPKPKPNY